ncbi:MAG: metallophosphoesterase [Lactococcus raffinolactis]|jgi:putative phosphoesterase|uniref:Phosphoesterase n=1 Tax=Pseudolactococcus raffinolactis TaxID=1366 RepID=A0A290Q505_9LACT|nr:metallophosphoesterase [Lactococcus raffinolactis]ATC60398.1 phosphoesterase [Lactococcus raffinolactis]MBW9330216.1 phosphoesterase [Lactococcus raffinolactis]MDG4961096.1 metallophosphoesterase [Lactococcus raffinolactis]QIW53610.1 phosphoesterase [Lactococcus raffinolactis]QIW60792.1 phosphoesterase [Lactococcus raffinolactis]
MKKLAILSDLHLDVNQFDEQYKQILIQTLQEQRITDIHLAGDISNDFERLSKPFLARLSQDFTVSYNLGNHDMLSMDESAITANDFQIRTIGQKKLLSFAGWYDYSFCPDISIEQNLRTKNTFWFDRKITRDVDDITVTNRILTKLDAVLTRMIPTDKANLIVAMHFVPHPSFVMTHPKFIKFNAFLGSDKFHALFVKHGIKDVVFGHNHRSYDRVIDSVHYQAKPLGYKREWLLVSDYFKAYPAYQSLNSYNLHKRYNLVKKTKEFDAYLLTHFSEELKKSLVIFDVQI